MHTTPVETSTFVVSTAVPSHPPACIVTVAAEQLPATLTHVFCVVRLFPNAIVSLPVQSVQSALAQLDIVTPAEEASAMSAKARRRWSFIVGAS